MCLQIKGELPKWPLPTAHCRLAGWESPGIAPRNLHSTQLPRLILAHKLARMHYAHSRSPHSVGATALYPCAWHSDWRRSALRDSLSLARMAWKEAPAFFKLIFNFLYYLLEVSQYLPLKLYIWKRAEMVTFPMARSTFLLRLWTKLGIRVDHSVISVLVLNWLLNSVNFVFLFTCLYSGSEQVGSADDLWGASGVLCWKSLAGDSEKPCTGTALCSAASLWISLWRLP